MGSPLQNKKEQMMSNPLSTATVMGILNVTPDSFSDGGQHSDLDAALEHAREMIASGASIIDVGGESTRPGAQPVTTDEELARTIPVIKALAAQLQESDESAELELRISIDTRNAAVAQAACAAGASIINDISGFTDPAMIEVALATGADCVLMHMQGDPQNMQDDPFYVDIAQEVGDFLLEGAARLVKAGIAVDKIILDPGFGFGKNLEHNLELFLHVNTLAQRVHDAGHRLLVGLSRKSMLGALFGIEQAQDRDEASAQLAAALIAAGADMVRTHNPFVTVRELDRIGESVAANTPEKTFIAFGSNLGGPVANIATAIVQIEELPLTTLSKLAAPVMSEPAYDSNQASFTNTVAEITTHLSASALFTYLQAIEVDMGREKTRINGPRVIDLDVLSFAQQTINLPALKIPHPRMSERAFVLEPLAEIAPGFTLPGGAKLTPAEKLYGTVTAQIPLDLLKSEIATKKENLARATQFQNRLRNDTQINHDDWTAIG